MVQRASNPWRSNSLKGFARDRLTASKSPVGGRGGDAGVYWGLPIGRRSEEWREKSLPSVCLIGLVSSAGVADLHLFFLFGLLLLNLGLGNYLLGLSNLLSRPLFPLLGSLRLRRVL